ncbi:flagellar motor protein MotB [Marivita sp.]|uniref:flagellar motor protein MotB n=1 Tax=Marivita sp. TaxID=2003365 RepID=UPI0025C2DE98|nr:flagellar motor protein MotB [Marivita sp.]
MADPTSIPNTRPTVIIKRPKKVIKGHHGGNWKVAYADFMTAMMAFFLLLWILSLSEPEKLEGLADYFTPASIPLVDLAGYDPAAAKVRDAREALLMDETPLWQATPDKESPGSPSGIANEAGANPWSAFEQTTETEPEDPVEEENERDSIDATLAALKDTMAKGNPLESLAGNLMVSRSADGVVVEIIDLGERPMFQSGSAELTEVVGSVLKEVAIVLADVPMNVKIIGHTDSTPFRGTGGYGNWELSADRANAARRALEAFGVAPERFTRVSGRAAVTPLISEDPSDARNRRITIELVAVGTPGNATSADDS